MERHNQEILLGIDPGSDSSGIIIFEDGKLLRGDNLTNEDLFTWIDKNSIFSTGINLTVVYEDIRPYTSRFNLTTINTCKMIGRLEYVLRQQRIPFTAITRNEVKSFMFKTFDYLVIPEIEKKIARKMKTRLDGSKLKPSFQYVDDRIVLKAMKHAWGIEKPKVGRTNQYGIKEHAWQALGCVSCYLHNLAKSALGTFDNSESMQA